jgi:hypothetical protein
LFISSLSLRRYRRQQDPSLNLFMAPGVGGNLFAHISGDIPLSWLDFRNASPCPTKRWNAAGAGFIGPGSAVCSASGADIRNTGPVTTPPMTGPLQAAPPYVFEGGALGKLSLNGAISGIGIWQDNPASSDKTTQAALSNGQVFLQKADGWWQFYVQAGAYTISALGTPFISTEKAVSDLFGPVPVAYLKLEPSKNTRSSSAPCSDWWAPSTHSASRT